MFILRRTHIQTEVVKWALLLAIATLAALLLATRMAGANDAPRPLPGDINTWAKPILDTADPPYFPEVGPPLRTNDPYRIVWRILRLHRTGQIEEALATWQRAELATGREVWQNIAAGAANLQAGALDAAEKQLDAALKMEPRNAVAHYYLGLLRLAQAGQAPTWPDKLLPPHFALIALPPIIPNTRDMYELDAMQELQNAIDLAPEIDLGAALVLDNGATGADRYVPMITPTVRDLLEALGADRYPARAHACWEKCKPSAACTSQLRSTSIPQRQST